MGMYTERDADIDDSPMGISPATLEEIKNDLRTQGFHFTMPGDKGPISVFQTEISFDETFMSALYKLTNTLQRDVDSVTINFATRSSLKAPINVIYVSATFR